MRDMRQALSDIAEIRNRLAASAIFMGFGPQVIAATGALALLVASGQGLWPSLLDPTPTSHILAWVATAAVCCAIVASEMLARARQHHGEMADAMIQKAIEQFLPAFAAGGATTLVLLSFAPEALWLLPGLWQLCMAIGLFAAARSLPRGAALIAVWYFLTGVAVLILASDAQLLAPWFMGVPFGVGQLCLGLVLHLGQVQNDA